MANPTVPVNTLAKLFNLTDRRVQQLAKDSIIPKADKGKYDLIVATRAYIKYLQERATGRNIEPQDAYIERARLLKAQADKTELEVKAMNGKLLAADQVELLWSGLVSSFRARMLALPMQCAHSVMSQKSYPEVVEVIANKVKEALEELSQYDPEHNDIEESSEAGSTTAATEDQPVGG